MILCNKLHNDHLQTTGARLGTRSNGSLAARAEKGKVLTEILPDVQQDFWRSSVQLVKQGAEAEEEQGGHAEAVAAQGKAPRQHREEAGLSTVPLPDVVAVSLVVVVAVQGTAAEILHHLLLTKRGGKSPIRLWKVKLDALRSLDSRRS